MHIDLHPIFRDNADAQEAADVVRSCVHCGICTATCPTYEDLGDERDGPRGRIYLIKHLLESGEASDKTSVHLDRCLTCRSCETACPSGVRYGRLLDIGKGILEPRIERSFRERLLRWGLLRTVSHRRRFALLLRCAQVVRPLLPASLKAALPWRQHKGRIPSAGHERRMLILAGCAQPGAKPNINGAAARVLDRLGISLVEADGAGCCGALSYHLSEHQTGLDFMRRNIDAWWPHITAGVEAIVMTASGCGVTVKDYGLLLKSDPVYAEKAQRVSAITKDLSEILLEEDLQQLGVQPDGLNTAVHCPCTLQHGQQLPSVIDDILERVGLSTVATTDRHSCCGSAGSYSILQPAISRRLLDRKLQALTKSSPDRIVTANIGCQLYLETKARIPVQNWIELLDERSSP